MLRKLITLLLYLCFYFGISGLELIHFLFLLNPDNTLRNLLVITILRHNIIFIKSVSNSILRFSQLIIIIIGKLFFLFISEFLLLGNVGWSLLLLLEGDDFLKYLVFILLGFH
jgi:hypothetical protein